MQNELIVEDGDLTDAAHISETLDGLSHQIYWSNGDAGLVWLYAQQLEARVKALGAVLRSADPNMRRVRARLWN